MAQPEKLVVLAAGGTGGHMFPAEALARELGARQCGVALITDRRGAGFSGALADIETHRIRAAQVAGRGLIGRLAGLLQLARGTFEARRLLRRLRPAAAVGFGGYASVPAMLAATFVGVPSVIHEQNAVLGRANRLLAPRVDCIATSFDTVSAIRPRDRGKVVRTGNPVRSDISRLANAPIPVAEPDAKLTILVLGGSQGATVFSRTVPAALALLTEDQRERLEIIQQSRKEDIDATRQAYEHMSVRAELATFFDDVAERLRRAHLVICRAGASTVAEITAAGRAAVLVPYPRAIDDHQTANARAVVDADGGWIMPEVELTPETLAARLQSLLADPAMLVAAATGARRAGIPDAAARLAELVSGIAAAGGWHPGSGPMQWEPAA